MSDHVTYVELHWKQHVTYGYTGNKMLYRVTLETTCDRVTLVAKCYTEFSTGKKMSRVITLIEKNNYQIEYNYNVTQIVT